MRKLHVSENDYYQDKYEHNGYIVTALPYGFVVWGKDGETVIQGVKTLKDAESLIDVLEQ